MLSPQQKRDKDRLAFLLSTQRQKKLSQEKEIENVQRVSNPLENQETPREETERESQEKLQVLESGQRSETEEEWPLEERGKKTNFAALAALEERETKEKEKENEFSRKRISQIHSLAEKTEQDSQLQILQAIQKNSSTKQLQTIPEEIQELSSLFEPAKERESAKIDVILTTGQEEASLLLLSGKSCCIIGAAGTGKTTGIRIAIQRARDLGKVSPFSSSSKYLVEGLPSIAVVSYTNKAVANIRRGMPKDITCVTAHKMIEFQPIYFELLNSEGEMQKTMRFEPARHRFNKLPHIDILIFEEASTISVPLFKQIQEALSGSTQYIFLGDIQQLPPVYGPAILGFKMLELPVVELKEVMRQALDSPVLAFAWEILKGKPLSISDISKRFDTPGQFKIRPWKKRLTSFNAMHVASLLVNQFIDGGEYDPINDMILIPYAKNRSKESFFCTDELNRSIAEKLGRDRNAIVHEVIAGFNKFYYAVGDKILVNKQEAFIQKISRNADYIGKEPLEPSEKMNRSGQYTFDTKEEAKESLQGKEANLSMDEIEHKMLVLAMQDSGQVEERKNQGSHVLHCKFLDSEEETDVRTTGEYAETGFAYALTVHKAQGSEWKRVILLLHNTHSPHVSRELLYTACTRARESLYIICEPDHFEKGILRQRIKGNTLEEKAEFFKGKLEDLNN